MSTQDLGKAYVQIVPSAKGIQGELTKSLNGETTAAGVASGRSLGKMLIKGIAAAGIGAAIKTAIGEGAALEQSLGGVETLYKDHANVVIANANKAWETAGISANQYMEQSTSYAASLLSSLNGDTAKAAKYADMAIIDMADNANKMGTDLEMIQNAYAGFSRGNYTMLDNLKLGFAGTKQGMNDLLAKAEEITGKKYSIENLADIYDAIHAVQTELDITGTTSKEAATTLTGSLQAMKAAGTNLLGALVTGADINGPMLALANSAATFFVNNLIPALGRLGAGFSNAAWAIGEQLSQHMDGISETAATLISNLVVGIVKNLPKLVGGALAIVGALSTALINGLVGAMRKVGKRAVDALMKNLDVRSKISAWISKVKSMFPFNIGKILNLKIPTITVSGGKAPWGIGGVGVKPSFNVTWHAQGGIFTKPTVLGNHGFGEAGAEAILPLSDFYRELDKRVAGGTVNMIIQLDGKTIGQSTIDYINGQTLMFGTSPVMV